MDRDDRRDYSFMSEEEMEEAARRRRARRKKDHQLKVLVTTVLILCLVCVAVLVYAWFLVPRDADLPWPKFLGARPQLKIGTTDDTKKEGNPLVNAIENQFAAQTEKQPVTETAPAPVIPETEKQTEIETEAPAGSQDPSAQQMISEAQLLAAGYDYDGAIALLSGSEMTEEMRQAVSEWESAKSACVAVDVNTVPHIFFHSLINDDRAFDVNTLGADRVRQNNAAMTTTVEFDHMIEDMYEAGYVLVSLDDMCVKSTGADGLVHIERNSSLMLPPDKKPFVLSIDDLSYYHSYGIGTQGYATKMVVDENGKPKCVYTDENGNTSVGDYDVVPRMDTFIEQHPDFAYHGARGTVAMTGYNGVFGYRTNNYYKDINDPHLDPDQILWLQEHPDFNWEQDCRDAKAVADAMKAEGWTFASHTYGHLNATSSDLDRLMNDHERWKTVNSPILGDIDKIIFAFGADIGGVGGYTPDNAKFQYFKGQGINIFCNVDGNIGWTEFGDTFMRTGRVALDGFTMYQAMTESAAVHSIYANDYEKLGIHDVASFFNQYRPTPIDSE